jgi:hypothetical protein
MIEAAPATTDTKAKKASTEARTTDGQAPDAPAAESPSTAAPAAAGGRKQNKFMADLSKAMQAAAESAREDTLARYSADAKAFVENIHADSATEATELRKLADDDVAAIREWSKAEIARIREETDERIAHRKNNLEAEIEEHAAAIEARIERVQARVNAFETDMSEFFERLLAEQDPTRFAAMAESLPEPPPFDGAMPEARQSAPAEPEAPVAEPEAPVVEPAAADQSAALEAAETETEGAEAAEVAAATDEAAQAAAATDEAAQADGGDLFSIGATEAAEADPRIAALGLEPDFAAAEAEAAAAVPETDGTDEEVPEIEEATIDARLANLVPSQEAPAGGTSTRVIVNGLISVASIAGFKRHLSRANGVQSVGVSSGPDGEFVFAVEHDAEVALRDVVATLPGFAARVTAESDGELTVAAQDPEAEG